MESCTIHLYQATDAEGSFALRLPSDPPDRWRAQTGFGRTFQKIWSIDFQSASTPDQRLINWETVLERAVEAFNLSDPVITNFDWPQVEMT